MINIDINGYGFAARAEFDTVEEAQAFAALFPKSLGVKATTLRTLSSWDGNGVSIVKGLAFLDAKLASDGANGGRNESGVRRAKRFLALAEAKGFETEMAKGATRADLDAALAA